MEPKMTKKELRRKKLNNHYNSLLKLSMLCNSPITDGKKLSLTMLKIENACYKAAEKWCNGDITEAEYNVVYDDAKSKINYMFPALQGFFINSDPRGYSLKIDLQKVDELTKPAYEYCGLTRDFGGYIILSPEIH